VTLVAHGEENARYMREHRRHPRSLPGVEVPAQVVIHADAGAALRVAEVVIIAIPVQALRHGVTPVRALLRERLIISASKGLELETLFRPSEVVRDVTGARNVAVLSGPNLAGEIAAGKPASTVIAAADEALATSLVPVLHSSRFRVYAGDDPIGAEMGGALKNIIAIGAGIADGLDAGDNAKAAFMTRGIAEIARLGVACGANALTFAGLSGIGDLMATCASRLSRNHQVGMGIAAGKPVSEILAGMRETAEGVATTRAALQLGARMGVELPIASQLHRVLFEGVSPADAIARLLEREPRRELAGN
jgi:glycerol-3-phosphate dehydrogenase (NAD(P)+)